MVKIEIIATGILDNVKKLTESFITLPFIVKLFLSPILLILSFTIILPAIAVFTLTYTIAQWSVSAIISLFKNRKSYFSLAKIIFSFLILSVFIFLLLMIAAVLFFSAFDQFPVFLQWMVLAMFGFFIIFLFLTGKTNSDNLHDLIRMLNEQDIQEVKNIISESSSGYSGKNPLTLLLHGPKSLLFSGSFLLSAGLIVLLMFTACLNSLFPDLFFNEISETRPYLASFLRFTIQEFLNVIPIDFLSPFIPKTQSVNVIQPWGNVLMIFVQTGMSLLLYFSIFTIYAAYKYKKPIKDKSPT